MIGGHLDHPYRGFQHTYPQKLCTSRRQPRMSALQPRVEVIYELTPCAVPPTGDRSGIRQALRDGQAACRRNSFVMTHLITVRAQQADRSFLFALPLQHARSRCQHRQRSLPGYREFGQCESRWRWTRSSPYRNCGKWIVARAKTRAQRIRRNACHGNGSRRHAKEPGGNSDNKI